METPDGQVLTAGRIVDETPPVIPLPIIHGQDVPLEIYAEAISWRQIQITRYPMSIYSQLAVRVPVKEEAQRAELRRLNLEAALKRANICVDNCFGSLTRHDDRFNIEALEGSEELMHLMVTQGFGVCQETITDKPRALSQTFAKHCETAAALLIPSHTRKNKKMKETTFLFKSHQWRRPAEVCPSCNEQLWYVPCCISVFCHSCRTNSIHEPACAAHRAAVPVQPEYRLEDGRRLVKAFDPLRHPLWKICRHLAGDKFTLTLYYHTEDAHFFFRNRGIRFEAFLFRCHSANSSDWFIHLSFSIRTMSMDTDIDWSLYRAVGT